MITVSTQRVASLLRQIAALTALVVGSLQDANVVPGKYGWVLQALGGVLLAVEHYVSDPSTGAGSISSNQPVVTQPVTKPVTPSSPGATTT